MLNVCHAVAILHMVLMLTSRKLTHMFVWSCAGAARPVQCGTVPDARAGGNMTNAHTLVFLHGTCLGARLLIFFQHRVHVVLTCMCLPPQTKKAMYPIAVRDA